MRQCTPRGVSHPFEKRLITKYGYFSLRTHRALSLTSQTWARLPQCEERTRPNERLHIIPYFVRALVIVVVLLASKEG